MSAQEQPTALPTGEQKLATVRNVSAVAGLILGIIAIALASTVFLSVCGLPVAVIGMVFSIIGLRKSARYRLQGGTARRGLAVTAVIVNGVAILAAVLGMAVLTFILNQ